MPPRVPALAQSENKTKFLERLGISSQDEHGKQIYTMMKVRFSVLELTNFVRRLTQLQEEAVAGRARMSESTACLLPELINDPNVKPPYSNTQINEAAMHAQTLYIYRTARPETRMYYELGHYHEGDTEENWVIKWLLWHVFRYRDNRNRGRSIASASPADRTFPPGQGLPASLPDLNNASAGMPASLTEINKASISAANRLPMGHQMGFIAPPPIEVPGTNMRCTTPMSMSSSSATTARPTTRDQYWDPVRDAQAINDNSRSHSPRP